MSSPKGSFDLSELADRAQVTPRTIRYYIAQGLLSSPDGRGPSARYDTAHLGRLLLIRQLQRQHLPLAEIRRRMAALSEGEVRSLIQEGPERARPSSALEYIRNLDDRSLPPSFAASMVSESVTPPIPEFSPMRPSPPTVSPSELPLFEWKAREQRPAHGVPDRSSWERIHLSPDIELHVRRPLTRDQNRQLDLLVAFAHQLFSEDT
jgi:DNA-binding transcriptional MerR regulator